MILNSHTLLTWMFFSELQQCWKGQTARVFISVRSQRISFTHFGVHGQKRGHNDFYLREIRDEVHDCKNLNVAFLLDLSQLDLSKFFFPPQRLDFLFTRSCLNQFFQTLQDKITSIKLYIISPVLLNLKHTYDQRRSQRKT